MIEHDDPCKRAQRALDLLGRSRCADVLMAILEGHERYGTIRERCAGISDAVLSARLRDLCDHGLAERLRAGRSITYVPTSASADVRNVLDQLGALVLLHPSVFT